MSDRDFFFQGKVFVFGDDIDTDGIIPANYLNLTDEKELASHCMEEIAPGFAAQASKGDILVAGSNFGCGSSREHAPLAIKGCGITCVVAKSFSRLFYRNAINIGLPVIVADIDSVVKDGDVIGVDCFSGKIALAGGEKEVPGAPLPAFMMEILRSGGLAGYLKRLLEEEGRM
jgi:3-isopropylmalate/(R)-2-methylmalate dehydratase small subunit